MFQYLLAAMFEANDNLNCLDQQKSGFHPEQFVSEYHSPLTATMLNSY